MSVLEFVASLVHSLAWPLAVALVAVILRKQIATMLDGPVTRLKVGPFEAEWERQAAEVGSVLPRPTDEGITTTAPVGIPPGELVKTLRPLIKFAPLSAIEEAYERIEKAVVVLMPEVPASEVFGAPSLAALAHERGRISEDSLRAIEGLAVMRNLAVHGPKSEVTSERAAEFVAIVDATLYQLGTQASGG